MFRAGGGLLHCLGLWLRRLRAKELKTSKMAHRNQTKQADGDIKK